MAFITDLSNTSRPSSGWFSRLWGRFAEALNASAERRSRQIEALSRLSDAELAEKGLRREDIARYVFRDILHI